MPHPSGTTSSTATTTVPPAAVARRKAWVSAHLEAARQHGPLPVYGDQDWHRLPPADPRRWAAVIKAAEAWAEDGDDIPGRLRRELAYTAAAENDLWVDDALAAEDAHTQAAAAVPALVRTPSYAQLQHRRGELTDEQLEQYETEWGQFVSGRTDTPPRVPKPEPAA